MSTPVNYYLGLSRGSSNNIYGVTAGTASAGTAVDVELRIQMDNGTTTTGITSLDVHTLANVLLDYLNSSGLNAAGTDLPPL